MNKKKIVTINTRYHVKLHSLETNYFVNTNN